MTPSQWFNKWCKFLDFRQAKLHFNGLCIYCVENKGFFPLSQFHLEEFVAKQRKPS